MILSDSFWEEEAEAPLLKRNAGFLSPQTAADIVDRAKGWVDLIEAKCGPVDNTKRNVCEDEALLRIFDMDAERTFSSPTRRNKMSNLVNRISAEIGDYHQGLGFVIAYLLLHVEDEDVITKIVLGLHQHYVSGYYKSAPRAYVRDAKVFYMTLEVYFPELYKHIKDMVPPEAFCSKWFIGFNVHVLPFPALIEFMENVFSLGQQFLFKFGLALCQQCHSDIMETKDVSRVLEILRLDTKVYADSTKSSESDVEGSFFTQLVDDAIFFELDKVNLDSFRETADEELRVADELRKERDAERDDISEIYLSDDDSSGDDRDPS